MPTPTSTPVTASTSPIVYSAPITISSGGTYSGNWESTDDNTPAVRINTAAPVTIQNCYLKGPGVLIQTYPTANVNVTVKNCVGVALHPRTDGDIPGLFFSAVHPAYIDIENNTMTQTSGIQIKGDHVSGLTINILRNKAYNIDGRYSNGAGGFQALDAHGMYPRQLRQFVQITYAPNAAHIEIGWNQVINDPADSAVEDNINLCGVNGTPGNHVTIHDNYIHGGYANRLSASHYSGGGITMDGAAGDTTLALKNGYIDIYGNAVINDSAGIGISEGHDITIGGGSYSYANRIISSGKTPIGDIKSYNDAINISDSYGHGGDHFYNNNATNNYAAHVNGATQKLNYPGDMYYIPGCNVCAGNIPPNGWSESYLPTMADEAAEYALWTAKLAQSGVSIGSTLPGG